MWEKIGYDNLIEKWVYNVKYAEVAWWIERQPAHMWKHYDIPDEAKLEVSISALMGQNYVFTEEMEAWLVLRWS